ncbi:hypothetical protein LOAG_00151 [Loa loa]|uniref:Uncharacterized protein n=1 Tax=Loa loa TaxID=7209 RepID=A0A1S0UCH9_LOALO|nr:hypothetical protein LOAG_00151 [Loa loa]EFO28332.1 hypothetical protein LOAG_00151 [Loa loa]
MSNVDLLKAHDEPFRLLQSCIRYRSNTSHNQMNDLTASPTHSKRELKADAAPGILPLNPVLVWLGLLILRSGGQNDAVQRLLSWLFTEVKRSLPEVNVPTEITDAPPQLLLIVWADFLLAILFWQKTAAESPVQL